MSELKPCPFCGGEAEVCEGGINGRTRVYGLIEHKDGCFFLADGLPTKYQHIMESEFDAWNSRAERTCEVVKGKCSNCGKDLPEDPYSDYEGNYCPNCGARVMS